MSRSRLKGVVEEFFERMADDDRRETVGELFVTDAVITVPGATFSGPDAPQEMLAHFAPRYEWAAKEFDRWYVDADRNAVVSVGTLHGVDIDGAEFAGVRYTDVYEVRDGRIARLDVYNDLADDGVVDL